MEFVETSAFKQSADSLLTDEEQRQLQNLLLQRPEAGVLLKGTGGLRKVRFGTGDRGSRGGVRAVYYHHDGRRLILLLVIFAKNRQDDLSREQAAQLRALVKKEFS